MRKKYDKRTGFPTYNVEDMWEKFVKTYLTKNPAAWTKAVGKRSLGAVYEIKGTVKPKPVLIIDYTTYSAILNRANELFKRKIIAGAKVNLMNNLGCIFAAELDSNPKRYIPDWSKFSKEGKVEEIFEDTYIAVIWRKFQMVKNETVYEFLPSRGNSTESNGFVQQFFKANRLDRILRTRYERILDKEKRNVKV